LEPAGDVGDGGQVVHGDDARGATAVDDATPAHLHMPALAGPGDADPLVALRALVADPPDHQVVVVGIEDVSGPR
jgi:hypothetical protein